MKIIFRKLFVLAIIMPLFSGIAQENDINIQSSEIQKADSVITLMSKIDLSNLEVDKETTITIYPKLINEGNSVDFAPIVINGRNKHILYNRKPNKSDYCELRRKNGTDQNIDYVQTVKYSPWMKTSDMEYIIDRCSCGSDDGEQAGKIIIPVRLDVMPYVAYLMPEAECIKYRDDKGVAYIDFPLNRVEVNNDFRNNAFELAKIFNDLEKVRTDQNLQITSISIHGFASPEGNYDLNKKLAEGRSKSLKEYLHKKYGINRSMIDVKFTPENWEGLREYVSASNLPDKQEILNVIDSDVDLTIKEKVLRNTASETSYQVIKNNFYPALRRSDYQINYIVKGFDTDEAKEILKRSPQQLSLREMYLAACTMEEGSEEFEELFDIAVRMFPDESTANLNASSIAIKKKDLVAAEKYLKKADINKAETLNNLGAVAFLKGNMEESKEYFNKASEMGLSESVLNLRDNVK